MFSLRRPKFVAAKLVQFFFQAGYGGTMHYLPLIYQNKHGIPEAQMGYLQSISYLIGFPACIIWAQIADRWLLRRRIMAVLAIATSTAVWCLFLNNLKYEVLAFLAGAIYFFQAPLIPISDALTLELLGEAKAEYGKQRLYGAIAAAMFSYSTGQIVSAISPPAPQPKNYLPAFVNFSFWTLPLLITLVVSYTRKVTPRHEIPRDPEILRKIEQIDPENPEIAVDHVALVPAIASAIHIGSSKISGTPRVRHWLLHKDVLAFYISIIGLNMGIFCAQTFIWPYLQMDLGASAALCAATAPMQILLELPFFFYSEKVLRKIGIKYSLVLAHIAIAARVILLTMMPKGNALWAVLAVELLHGFSFACMWNSAVAFADLMAPPNRASTSQGAMGAAQSLGAAAGSALGGELYSRYGSRVMWLTMAAVALVTGVIYLFVPMRDLESRKQKLDLSAIDETNDKKESMRGPIL